MRNPAVDFEDLLRNLHSLVEGTFDDPSDTDYPRYLAYLDLSLAEIWDSEWWPDLMVIEERYLRDIYSTTATYVATNEVYYQGTQLYYQCIKTHVAGTQAPATGDPLAENSAYWAECKTSYSASDWVTATAYVAGDKVFYPPTNRYYQCHTAHTSSASLFPSATGADGRWGVLTNFNRYIPWVQTGYEDIGDPFDVKDSDPRLGHDWESVEWGQSADGIQVLEDVTSVWIQYRQRRPILSGALYDSSSAYAVGDQVYFTPTGGRGNLYDCIATASAGDTPSTDTDKWEQVVIPRSFQNFLVWAAYARCLVADGKHESVAGAREIADQALQIETDRIYRLSAQTPSLPVRTY